MVYVQAVYRDSGIASRAVNRLVESGFAAQDIGAVLWDEQAAVALPIVQTNGVGVGAALGACLGSVVGALVMGLGYVSSEAGIVEQATWGAIAGAVFGALVGAIGGLGYWKITLQLPKQALRHGARVLLGIAVNEGRVAQAERVLMQATRLGFAARRQERSHG